MTFISYAQNNEDVMLHRALKDVDRGVYIDVGANSPVVDSVTKLFYDAGWRGINIEPVSEWFEMITQERPDDINLHCAAAENKGEIDFYEFVGTGLSTMDVATARENAQRYEFEQKTYKVPTVRLASVCEQYFLETIHFLKVDVEGGEVSVLKGMNFERFRPWIVLVESTIPNTQIENYENWTPILAKNGYHFVYFDGLNRFYVADERQDLDRYFRIPPNIFDDFVRARELNLVHSNQQLQRSIELNKDEILSRARKITELKGVVKDLQVSLESSITSAATRERENAELTKTVHQLFYECEVNRAYLSSRNGESVELTNAVWQLQIQLEKAKKQQEECMQTIIDIYQSNSWYVTYPLRKLRIFLGKLFPRRNNSSPLGNEHIAANSFSEQGAASADSGQSDPEPYAVFSPNSCNPDDSQQSVHALSDMETRIYNSLIKGRNKNQ